MRLVKSIMITSLVSTAFMVTSANAASHHSGRSFAKASTHTKSHVHHVKSGVKARHAKPVQAAAPVAANHQLPLPATNAKLTS